MGSDFRWVMCGLSADQYQSVQPDFQAARQAASISAEDKKIYELCRKSPEKMLPRYIPPDELPPEFDKERYSNGYIDAELSIQFSTMFRISPFEDLFYRLPINEEMVLKFISCDLSPAAILYYALGVSRAEQLPCYFGNSLLDVNDLGAAMKQVDSIFSELDDEAWDRARRYISPCTAGKASLSHDENIHEVFSALPEALRSSYERQQSFLSVGFWMG